MRDSLFSLLKIYRLLPITLLSLLISSENQGNCHEPCIFSAYQCNPNRVFLTVEIFHLDLTARIKNINVRGDKTFYGLRIGYERLKPRAFYGALEYLGSYASGPLNGSQDSKHITLRHHDDTFFGNLELRLGYTFAPCKWLITPTIGISVNGVDPEDKDHDGYKEMFPSWAFGVRAKFALSSCSDIGLNLKVLRTLHGERRFKSKEIYHKEFNNSLGGEIGLPLTCLLGHERKWEIQLEPYFLKLDFSRKTDIFGSRLRLGYLF